jgi:cysteine-rich repeat protein
MSRIPAVKWLGVLVAAFGCVSSQVEVCENGWTCPAGTECRTLSRSGETVCATDDQLAACMGAAPDATCALEDVATARCYDGVCVDATCGNQRTDVGEQCDDGNSLTGDGCSADCLSNERCGNEVLDLVSGEDCDDGNAVDHDGCSSTCAGERLHWAERTLTPPGRQRAVAAYDPIRGRIVMFSGANDNGVLGDVWEWDGGAWTQFRGPTPPGRIPSAMAFDGTGVLVYGGSNVGLSDTWTFDGVSWRSHAVSGPGPRVEHAMAYDAGRKRVVLFGGVEAEAGAAFVYSTGTWEWAGATWTQHTTAHTPPLRYGASMAYDPVHGTIVLAGGAAQSADLTDTWVYDGTDWTERLGAGWPALVGGSAAFDPVSGTVIAFGGQDINGYSGKTLSWNGTTWTDLAIAGPSERTHGQMASTGDHIVWFSGAISGTSTPPPETWIFKSGAWSQPVTPGGLTPEAIAYANDLARGRLVLFDGSSTWELSSSGWELRATGTPSSRTNTAMAYDPIARNVILFGGRASMTPLGDTWIWDGTSWTEKVTPPELTARAGVAMAFDGTHVTLRGGFLPAGGTPSAGTWSWDGTSWSVSTSANEPAAGPSAYDPVRNELVTLVGTATWTYDGSTWVDTGASPPSHDAPLVWNPARKKLQLVGGSDVNDLWEWDGSAWTRITAEGTIPSREGPLAATAIDGTGVFIYGGSSAALLGDAWELRWDGAELGERCDDADADRDGLVGCLDPDCWSVCSPTCSPETSCPATEPRCGDGACDAAHETCVTCADDCTCTPSCGDFTCTPNETTCPGDCP